MAEYGAGVVVGARVEISPHYDLWMRGARWGRVERIWDGIATVKMDNTAVKKLQRFPVADLKPA